MEKRSLPFGIVDTLGNGLGKLGDVAVYGADMRYA